MKKYAVFLIGQSLLIALLTIGCGSTATQTSDKSTVNEQNDSVEEAEVEEETMTLDKHLRSNTFTLNGGGSVSFNFTNGNTSGTMRVSGGRADLLGKFTITSSSMLKVEDLKAVTGMFDASNNEGSFGTFYYNSDGTLTGSIGNYRESRDVTLAPN
jgi:hypothetical protein